MLSFQNKKSLYSKTTRLYINFYFRVQELSEEQVKVIEKSQSQPAIKQGLSDQILEIENSIQVNENEGEVMSNKIVALEDSLSSDHNNLKLQIASKETALDVLMQSVSQEEKKINTLNQVSFCYT